MIKKEETMSHFTKIKTKLRDRAMIKKALGRMGLSFEEGEFNIARYGKSETAQIKLNKDVGLSVQKDGTWAMVGDFYYSSNQKLKRYYNNNAQFNSDLSTAYAIEEAKETLTSQQFFCTENEEGNVGEDGLIRLVFESF